MYDIFVNYRHEDGHAVRALKDKLEEEFALFIDADMPSGARIGEEIDDALNQVRIVIAIIGEKWVSKKNLKRLHQPDDWIKKELCHALDRRDVVVIPVIVDDDVKMPTEDKMPEALHPFLLCKARRLHTDNWDEDVRDFIDSLRTQLRAGMAPRARPRDLPSDIPYLCDRVQQEQDFEMLAAEAQASRTLVCVLHGHKYEAHSGFVTRLRLRRKLEQAFGTSGSGVDVHPLEWNRRQASAGKHEDLLRSAIKGSALKKSNASDDELYESLRHVRRPVILMMQVAWTDLQLYGESFLNETVAAWKRVITQLGGPPAQALLLWINLSYDDASQKLTTNDLPQLERLGPIMESDIQTWLALDEVQAAVAGHEMALLDIASDSKYCVAPGQVHMLRFVDAVREKLNTKR
jgi:hypothetical protein